MTFKKLYAKLSAFLFSSSKRQRKKTYKPVDINKYRNVSLSKDTLAQMMKLLKAPSLKLQADRAPSCKHQAPSNKPQA